MKRRTDLTPPNAPLELARELLRDPGTHLNPRRMQVLTVIAAEPGLSTREVAVRVDVKHSTQMSWILGSLVRLGLVEDASAPRTAAKAWRITSSGRWLERALRDEAPVQKLDLPPDLPRDSLGRVEYRTALVLRVIGEEPGLNNSELSLRAGVPERSTLPKLLSRLAELGLVSSERLGGANSWQLTASGERVDQGAAREISVPPRKPDPGEHPGGRRGASTPRRPVPPARPTPVPSDRGLEQLGVPAKHLNFRRVMMLAAIAREPGMSSQEVAARVGAKDRGDMSPSFSRLVALGLVEDTSDRHRRGVPKTWRLTARGHRLERAIREQAPAPQPDTSFEPPQDFLGRLEYGAISALRAIGDRPGLSNREVALRAGMANGNALGKLLRRLADLGLLASARDPRRRGAPHGWQLTKRGAQLEMAIGRETPAPRRSPALDAMLDAGGRLSGRAVAVLMLIADDPGLSNAELGERVGVSARIISTFLARLARRGLIENPPTAGREKMSRLTALGKELEAAIRGH